MTQDYTRRAAIAALTSTLAGCNQLLEGNPDRTTPDPTETPTPEPETPSLELTGNQEISIAWSPELQEYEEVPEEHQTSVTVEPGDYGFDRIKLLLEEPPGTEEPGIRRIDITEPEIQIPANHLFTGPQNAVLEYQTQDGKQQAPQPVPLVKNIPQGYRIDIRNTDGEPIGDWATPYAFDTLNYRPNELEAQRTEYHETELILEGFLEDVRNDRELVRADFFPNYQETENKYGYFDLEAWKNETEFEQVLQWMNPAVRTKTFQNKQGAMSQWAPNMAASIEKAIDEIHPNFDAFGWGFTNSGAHGTMMFYLENNDGEHQWIHSDTTAGATDHYVRKPENAQLHRPDVWSPFTSKDHDEQPGFHPGPVKEELLEHDAFRDGANREDIYQIKSSFGSRTLRKMAGIPRKGLIFMTDTWMDQAYEHIRNDQPIDPIIEPIQQLSKIQDENTTVGLFGTLDNPKIVAGEQDAMMNLYHDSYKDPDILIDEEHIHDYIEDLGTTQYEIPT